MISYFFFLMIRGTPGSTRPVTLLPYTTLFRSRARALLRRRDSPRPEAPAAQDRAEQPRRGGGARLARGGGAAHGVGGGAGAGDGAGRGGGVPDDLRLAVRPRPRQAVQDRRLPDLAGMLRPGAREDGGAAGPGPGRRAPGRQVVRRLFSGDVVGHAGTARRAGRRIPARRRRHAGRHRGDRRAAAAHPPARPRRSDERRVGKACGSTCRARVRPYHTKNKKTKQEVKKVSY